jgi:hypothetical protein
MAVSRVLVRELHLGKVALRDRDETQQQGPVAEAAWLAVRGVSAAKVVPEATEEWVAPGIVVEMAAGMALRAASRLELEVVVVASHLELVVAASHLEPVVVVLRLEQVVVVSHLEQVAVVLRLEQVVVVSHLEQVAVVSCRELAEAGDQCH